jgi:small ligand-binding sensory domain FIST
VRFDGSVVRCGDGLAVGADVVRAADLACTEALLPLDDVRPDLACVFVSGVEGDDAEAALLHAAERLNAKVTLGCTGHGVLGSARSVEQIPAASVWTTTLPGVRTRAFHLEVLRTDESLSVVGMPPIDDATVGLLFADAWTFPVDGFVTRSNAALAGLPLVGGLAAGSTGAGSTRLLIDGRVVERGAVGVLLSGSAFARTLVSQGCRPIGPVMTVTAAEGNVLLGLAGRPALERLKEVVADLSPEDQTLAVTGLQIGVAMDDYVEEHGYGDFLVRGVVAADDVRGAVAVGDIVEVGRTVQFQLRDAGAADTDLALTLRMFHEASDFKAAGALLISSNGRGRALFDDAAHDVLAVREGLGIRRVAGFFAAGEIGPVGGRNHVHGFSASMLVVGQST